MFMRHVHVQCTSMFMYAPCKDVQSAKHHVQKARHAPLSCTGAMFIIHVRACKEENGVEVNPAESQDVQK